LVWDPVWEEVFRRQAWGKYPSIDVVRFIARNFYHAENRKLIKILEVGCGPGANLWYIAREGFSVYGIDGSETAITQARKRLNQECPGWTGKLRIGNIASLPYQNDFFDAVVDCEAISCNSYNDSKRIYTELSRVTKKGGKLFSQAFATGCWGDSTGKKVGHNAWIVSGGPLLNKGYARFTEYEEIKDLIGGFTISEIELLTRTSNSRQHEVREWIIIGEKI
jgi:ubiquinone/menaquinone biosynthesis C-methylase UbiE